MNNLTKEQMDSVTLEQIKTHRRLKAILANMDIQSNDPQWLGLMREGMAAREAGLTFKRIEAVFEERARL